jgi:predicted DNA-binding transcriptional regulator AlpA
MASTLRNLQDAMHYPPRGMSAERAAAYLGFSRSSFLRLVDEGVMPPPVRIRGVVTWDRLDLDAAYEDIKSSGKNQNTVHRLLRERRHVKQQAEAPVPEDE